MIELDISQKSSTSGSSTMVDSSQRAAGVYPMHGSVIYTSPGSTLFATGILTDFSVAPRVLPIAVNSAPTFGSYVNVFTSQYEVHHDDFQEVLASFYSKLIEKQESLGKEFEDAIADNLWSLYIED